MATRTSRTALLSVVNTISKRNHLPRRTNWNGDARSRARIDIRSLGRVCFSFDDIAGRSRGTRARGSPRVTCGTTLIDDPVNTSANVVGYIERPIGPDCDTRGT